MSRPNPLSPDLAQAKIREIAETGEIFLTPHCEFKSMPDANVEEDDVLLVLQTGAVMRAPEWDDLHNNWKYRVEGEACDKMELTAIAVIIERDWLIKVITVF